MVVAKNKTMYPGRWGGIPTFFFEILLYWTWLDLELLWPNTMAKLHHGKATSVNIWTLGPPSHTNHRDNLYDETLVWSLWSHTDTKKTGADNYVTELSNKDVVDVEEIDPRQANTCSNGSNSTITTTQQLRRLGSILQSSFFVIISIVTWKNRRIKVAQKWFH